MLRHADEIKKTGKMKKVLDAIFERGEQVIQIFQKYPKGAVIAIAGTGSLAGGGYTLHELLENPDKYISAIANPLADAPRRALLGPTAAGEDKTVLMMIFLWVCVFLIFVLPLCFWIFLKYIKLKKNVKTDNTKSAQDINKYKED